VFTGNEIVGVKGDRYPRGNRFPTSLTAPPLFEPARGSRSRSRPPAVGADISRVLAETRQAAN
jgi:hypothetical protein